VAEMSKIHAQTPTKYSAGQLRNAAVSVAGYATGVEDCRELLAMLGLIPNPRKHPDRFDEYGAKRKKQKRPKPISAEPGTSGWRPA